MRNVPHTRLADDTDIKEIYTFEKKLGQGGFGTVFAATHIEKQTKWAIKVICKPEKIYLVTELCSGGELKKVLEEKIYFTEDETRHIIGSLTDAMVYLHKNDIVHQDLKLQNILVKRPLSGDKDMIDIKVSDFGLSEKMGGTGIENMLSGTRGTLMYMAPEKMKEQPFSKQCDLWSIGVIMYMLLCGEPPYRSTQKEPLLKEISEQKVKFTHSIWNTVSDEAKNILTSLLKEDPGDRLSAGQLLDSPWITSYAGFKPSRQMSTEQQDKVQNSPHQFPHSHQPDSSTKKADNQKPSTSCKVTPASSRPAAGCNTKNCRSNKSKK